MPKATYMYWQKRFDRVNPDKEIEEKILEIRKNNKDYGYRRIYGALRNLGYIINKKKVQRIIQKLGLQVTSFTRKSRKYNSYKGKIGKILKVFPKTGKIIVEGVNIQKRHVKPNAMNPQGEVVEREMPIFASKVMIWDESAKKPTRTRKEFRDGKKVRVSVVSGNEI